MKYIIYLTLFAFTVAFTGCGGSPEPQVSTKIEEISYEDMVKEKKKDITFGESESIKYLSYKPEVLGKGLIYQTINNLFIELKKNEPEIFSKTVKLSVKFVNNSVYKYDLINEVRIFSKDHNYEFIEPKSIIQKLETKIFKKRKLKKFDRNRTIITLFFEPLKNRQFMLYITDNSNKPIVNPLKFSLTNLEENRNNIWKRVSVPYGNKSQNRDSKDKYEVLKDVVYENNIALSNKNFEEADLFCRKQYQNSSIISLYVFEYALRNGKIKPPKGGVYREFIAPYDEDLGDNKYLNYGDEVKIEDKEDTSQSQVLVYNWNKREYEKVLRNSNKNIAFRCMLFKGQE